MSFTISLFTSLVAVNCPIFESCLFSSKNYIEFYLHNVLDAFLSNRNFNMFLRNWSRQYKSFWMLL